MSISYINKQSDEQNLRNETGKLISILELAKKKAYSADYANLVCDGGFNGYEVDISGNNYSLYLRCGGQRMPEGAPLAINTFNLVKTSVIAGDQAVIFSNLNSEALMYDGLGSRLDSLTITLQNNSSTPQCLDIVVNSSGRIDPDETLRDCP